MAEALARKGITCLLFDKRGAGRTKAPLDVDRPSFASQIAYTEAWIARLRQLVEPSRPIFLIGHSEGGHVILALGARVPSSGVVLLATAGRPIDAILEEQLKTEATDLGLDEAARKAQFEQVRRFFRWLRTKGHGDQPLPDEFARFIHLRRWYTEMIDVDPIDAIRKIKKPILILQGDADIQVSVADARSLEAAVLEAGGNVTTIVFPEVDHLFKRTPPRTNIRNYSDSRRRVARDVILAVESFITRVVSGPEACRELGTRAPRQVAA
jgi:pimeloyl-ACP methyl ester carboxylesterase